MTGTLWLGVPAKTWGTAVLIGIGIGAVYVLSPLTVWFAAAMIVLVRWTTGPLHGDEKRWVTTILIVAIVLRVAAVVALFATTNHAQVAFGTFFGDEELYLRRSIWLRNVALGLPMHGADLIYTYDESGWTSHLYVLAAIQVLVGPAPYGVHLLGIAFYLTAALLLFRLARTSLGRMPALVGLTVVLFLPSLFAWSISALKEPLFFLLTSLSVVFSVRFVRDARWSGRLRAALAVALLAAGVETVRAAGAALSATSIALGLFLAFVASRPRALLSAIVAAPIVIGLILSAPLVQVKAYKGVQAAAKYHWGHVFTPGYVFKSLDERFYRDVSEIDDMHFDEAARFLVRSVKAYVTAPLPWEARSASTLAYLPEQVVWYVLIVFAAMGLFASFRRDALVAAMLIGHAAVAAMTVAFFSGNIGTLVRHRGLALPYFVWISGVGLSELLTRYPSVARPSIGDLQVLPHAQ